MTMTKTEEMTRLAADVLADPEWTMRVVVAAVVAEDVIRQYPDAAFDALNTALTGKRPL